MYSADRRVTSNTQKQKNQRTSTKTNSEFWLLASIYNYKVKDQNEYNGWRGLFLIDDLNMVFDHCAMAGNDVVFN